MTTSIMNSKIPGHYKIAVITNKGTYSWEIYKGSRKTPLAKSSSLYHSFHDAQNEADYFITCLHRATQKENKDETS